MGQILHGCATTTEAVTFSMNQNEGDSLNSAPLEVDGNYHAGTFSRFRYRVNRTTLILDWLVLSSGHWSTAQHHCTRVAKLAGPQF